MLAIKIHAEVDGLALTRAPVEAWSVDCAGLVEMLAWGKSCLC